MKTILSFICCLALACLLQAQPISPLLNGQNFHYTDYNSYENPQFPFPYPAKVKAGGTRLLRMGGAQYNTLTNKPSATIGYVALVDKARAEGFEPVLTIPLQWDPTNTVTVVPFNTALSDAVIKAQEIINHVNVVHKRNVKYVIIANEPGIDYSLWNYDNNDPASVSDLTVVATYIKALSKAVKDIDPQIKTIGPEIEFYHYSGAGFLYNLLFTGTGSAEDISGLITAAGPSAGLPILDFASVHQYVYRDVMPTSGYSYETVYTKLEKIDKSNVDPSRRYRGVLNDLRNLCSSTNTITTIHRNNQPLGYMITEANITHDSYPSTIDWDTRSAVGGRLWARMLALAAEYECSSLMFWSISEGAGTVNDRGYLDGSGNERPSYYHYKAFSTWFHGTYMADQVLNNTIASKGNILAGTSATFHTIDETNTSTTAVRASDFETMAFAAKGENITVMVLNHSTVTPKSFSVKFDGSNSAAAFTGTANCKFGFNAGLSGSVQVDFTATTGTLAAIAANSSALLIFDCSGNLLQRYNALGSGDFILEGSPGSAISFVNPAAPTSFNCLGQGSSISINSTNVSGATYTWYKLPSTTSFASGAGNTLSNLSPGAYLTTVSGGNLCGTATLLNVVHEKSALVDAGPDKLRCAASVSVGNAFLPASQFYSWSASTGTAPTGYNPSVSPNTPTDYTLQASLPGSVCPISDVVQIDIFNAGTAYSLCPGQKVQMDAFTDATSFTWSPATGLSATNIVNPYLTAANTTSVVTTIYNLTTSDGSCPGTSTVEMTFFPTPTITALYTNTTICLGNTATLSSIATGAGPFSYIWTPYYPNITTGQLSATATVNPPVTTVFTEKVIGANSCVNFQTYTVNVDYQSSSFSYPSSNICSSSGVVLPTFSLSAAGNFSSNPAVNGFLDPITGALTPSAVSAFGVYTITNTVSTCGGSVSTATVNIVGSSLTANAGPDRTTFLRCRQVLTGSFTPAVPSPTLSWLTQSGGVFSSMQSAVVYSAGIYVFSVNDGSCTSFDDMKLNVSYKSACLRWKWPIEEPTARIGCGGSNPSKTMSGVLNSDKLVSNDTLWITGNLTIINNKSLTIKNTLVIISPGVKILVQPGAALNISGSMLQTCDGSKWQGIVVLGNNNAGGQLAVESTILMDAPTVVKAEKAVGVNLTENLFYGGDVAINLDRNKEFIIQNNEFNNYNIGIKTTKTASGSSIISGNSFYAVKTAISFDGDDHSKLILACNNFENYRDYAVDSKSTILQDQGSIASGAGNKFAGSATPTDKISHSGNSMKYYYDPSSPVAAYGNVLTQPALYDASCVIVTARISDNGPVKIETETTLNTEVITTASIIKGIEMQAFPNPFRDQLTIVYALPVNSKAGTLKIFEAASGKEIFTTALMEGQNKIELNEFNVAAGMYICTLFAGDGSSKSFKLVNIK